MNEQRELVQLAKAHPKEQRKKILMSFKETKLHYYLKELLQAMQSDYTIEITHQAGELGKDLVIVKKDKIGFDVTGVVVKKGNIKGKTIGDVDEVKAKVKNAFSYSEEKKIKGIESQVEQALAHPAEMKTIFKKLPVHSVLIVLAGEISIQGRKRLEKELMGNIEIKDINWLIDAFTEHYPQIFFKGRDIDFILKKIQQLETKHWLSSRKINLSDCFVEPLVSTIDSPLKIDEEHLALFTEKRKIPFLRLKSILKQARRVILIGDPGVGKSSALAKLTIDMLRDAFHLMSRRELKKEIKIPVLVSAKEILKINNYETLLKDYFGIPKIMDRFKVQVIMIDALDEVSSTEAKDIIKKAEKFSQQLACSLVISSRKIDIVKTPQIGFEKYELLPFEYGQAIKLFEKVAKSKEILDPLKYALSKIQSQIPMVPLSLMLLMELVENEKEVPASITELYERFFELMLGRWDREKGIKVLFEYYVKGSFLAELAYREYLEKKKLEISQKEFTEFINNYSSQYGWDKKELEIFIKEIDRAGIIDIREKVLFRHRSFLDYSAAHYIFDKRAEIDNLNDLIVKIYFDDTWGDVAFFYVGLMRKISDKILEKIFSIKEESLSTYIDQFLVGRLIQAGWLSPTKIKYDGIKQAVTFAPLIKEKFLKFAEKSRAKLPKIYADCLIMILSELSFGSGFLYEQAKSLFSKLPIRLNEDNLYQMLSILSAINRFLNQSELRQAIDKCLEMLSRIPDMNPEEQARALLFLILIEQKDEIIVRKLKSRLYKLRNRCPEAFKRLLPPKRKGFR